MSGWGGVPSHSEVRGSLYGRENGERKGKLYVQGGIDVIGT
jgi:hypothetical protein